MVSIKVDTQAFDRDYTNEFTWLDPDPLRNFELDLIDLFENDETDYDALTTGAPTELAANRIVWEEGDTKLTLTGSGISPVSSLDDLEDAIDEGIAEGDLSKVVLTFGDTDVASLDFSAQGISLKSGGQELIFQGRYPTSLQELADLVVALSNIGTDVSRGASNTARIERVLAENGFNGLKLLDGGTEVLDLTLTEKTVSLSAGGVTLAFNGSFEFASFDSFIDSLEDLNDLLDQDPGSTDLSLLGSLSDFSLTTDDGLLLLSARNLPEDLSRVESAEFLTITSQDARSTISVNFADQSVAIDPDGMGDDFSEDGLDFSVVDLLVFDTEGSVSVVGDGENNVIAVDAVSAGSSFTDPSTDDTDRLELDSYRYTLGDESLVGFTLLDFLTLNRFERIDGQVVITDRGTGDTWTLDNIEQLRFVASREDGTTEVIAVADILAGVYGNTTAAGYPADEAGFSAEDDDVEVDGSIMELDLSAGGSDRVSGPLANFANLAIDSFGEDDVLSITDRRLADSEIDIDQVTGQVTVDGTPLFTVKPSDPGGSFMVLRTGHGESASTVVQYVQNRIDLSEGRSVNPDNANGIAVDGFLSGENGQSFTVTLEDFGAAFNNFVGYYIYDRATGAIETVGTIVDETASASSGDSVTIAGVGADKAVAFFLGLDAGPTLSTVTDLGLTLDEDGDLRATDGGDLLADVILFTSFNSDQNPDDIEHFVSGSSDDGTGLRVGIEDQLGGGDLDYQDITFVVTVADDMIA